MRIDLQLIAVLPPGIRLECGGGILQNLRMIRVLRAQHAKLHSDAVSQRGNIALAHHTGVRDQAAVKQLHPRLPFSVRRAAIVQHVGIDEVALARLQHIAFIVNAQQQPARADEADLEMIVPVPLLAALRGRIKSQLGRGIGKVGHPLGNALLLALCRHAVPPISSRTSALSVAILKELVPILASIVRPFALYPSCAQGMHFLPSLLHSNLQAQPLRTSSRSDAGRDQAVAAFFRQTRLFKVAPHLQSFSSTLQMEGVILIPESAAGGHKNAGEHWKMEYDHKENLRLWQTMLSCGGAMPKKASPPPPLKNHRPHKELWAIVVSSRGIRNLYQARTCAAAIRI